MEASLRQVDEAEAERPLAFDRESGMLTGAGVLDRVAVLALQAGSILTRHYGHRGYRLGCKAVANLVTERDVVVRLNGDADFAFPFCDGYWSRTLNRNYDYEEEIEAFLRSASDVRYSFVDCGANFGYWSVLASSRPFGGQATLAIEASRENAKRLARNARLNGGRFRWLNAAVGEASGGFARITGARHEAFGTLALAENEPEAVPIVSLDGLAADGLIDAALPVVIKLDVEGVEIEALAGAAKLLRRDCVVICEEHGLDRSHGITRHLIDELSLHVFVFDPELCHFIRLDGVERLDRIKKHAWVGYNVFATSSTSWEERLLAATWRGR
ncbi:MAG: FkbM family methyltransferase [Pseudomonadota bacterium]|nr:methyltransferase [Afipia sp.]OUX62013.1 MAG: methyltransferase [Afipia sp. TMED4]HAP11594.1 FkbM family methyltransferase [Afipia sp.]HAP49358.1 FkbM family methyltransferase [Afipia sp.]HCX17280.1 FkbM family methyltransferase [Afipia sp.]